MNKPTYEEQKQLVRQMEATYQELERMRREALRGLEYNWRDVCTLLDLGDSYDGPPRLTSGLEEMQYWFMKAAGKVGAVGGTGPPKTQR